jgi:general secretion pathway protein D
VILCLIAAGALLANEPSAAQLYREGRKAERAGHLVRAYLLYSEAAAKDPRNTTYWAHSQALRTRAAIEAKAMPKLDEAKEPSSGKESGAAPESTGSGGMDDLTPADESPDPPGFSTAISDNDLLDLRRLKGPPELTPAPGKKNIHLQGDAKAVFEQVARDFGIEVIFDGDYQGGKALRLHLDDVDFLEALRAADAATGSFAFPLGPKVIMVVKDTEQKRNQNEPTVAVAVPIPNTVSVQEAQELGRGVQQTMDITRLWVDANRRIILIKDRVSKVRPAQKLFEELAQSRAQVMIQLQLLQVDRSNVLSYGFLMPTQFPLFYLGGGVPSMLQTLARFAAGHTTIGLGIANARLFATLNESTARTLFESEARSLDGSAVNFHVGQKYPILTGGFLGQSIAGSVPSFNFEDLGLSIKVTPHVHGTLDVSLDVEAAYEVLAGQSLNGIPAIGENKLQSKVRVHEGEWAVVAGMVTTSQAKSITGPAGLAQLPVIGTALRQNNRDNESTEVLIVLRPVLLNVPPDQYVGRALWVGSETRLAIPL